MVLVALHLCPAGSPPQLPSFLGLSMPVCLLIPQTALRPDDTEEHRPWEPVCVPVHVCACVSVCVLKHTCACTCVHVESKGQSWLLLLRHSPPFSFLWTGSFTQPACCVMLLIFVNLMQTWTYLGRKTLRKDNTSIGLACGHVCGVLA